MKLSDKIYIRGYIDTYYLNNWKKVYMAVREPHKREWAFLDISGKMVRHLHLPIEDDLKKVIESHTPVGIYHSASIYEKPAEEMEDKNRLSTDLIFDLDADHMYRVNIKKIYKCKNKECGKLGFKEICEECGQETKTIPLIDDEVLKDVSKELERLVKVLTDTLDLSQEFLKPFFSGSRGFHIHIDIEPYTSLDDLERIGLKDFLTLDGVDVSLVRDKNAYIIDRITDDINTLLTNLDDREVKQVFKHIKTLLNKRDELLDFLKSLKEDKDLLNKVNKIVIERLGIGVDPAVLTDLSRLIRAPYSLHGKSGLVKTPIEYEEIDDSSIIKRAMPSNVSSKVFIHVLPQVIWGGEEYGPYYNEYAILPESLAIYLVNLGIGESISVP